MNGFRWIAAAVCCAGLTACGSATDAVTFKAPAGYESAASLGPFMQLWKGPSEGVLMLMAMPTKIDLSKIVDNANVRDAQVLKQTSLRICGNQPAVYASMIGERGELNASPAPSVKAEKDRIDILATNVNGKTYMAMYRAACNVG